MFSLSESTDDELTNKRPLLRHSEFVDIIDHLNAVHGKSWSTQGRFCGSRSHSKHAKGIILAAKYCHSGGRNRYNPALWTPRAYAMLEAWCDCDPKPFGSDPCPI